MILFKIIINIRLTIYNKYVIEQNYLRDKDFMFCCDLLKLKEYEEFEKKIKPEYYVNDNFLLVMETINTNDVEHFKYIEKYIELKYINDITLYCYLNNLNNIADYLLLQCKNFDYENCAFLSEGRGYIYFTIKYHKYLDFNDYKYMSKVIKYGSLKEIQFIYNKYNPKLKHGTYEIYNITVGKLEWLHKYNKKLHQHSILIIIRKNNIILMKCLIKHKYKFIRSICTALSTIGSLEMIRLISTKFDYNCIEYIITRGDIKILTYIHETKHNFYKFAMDNVKANKKNTIIFLRSIGCDWTDNPQLDAIKNNIEMVKWLNEMGYPKNNWSILKAIEYNNLEMVKYLYNNGWIFSGKCFYAACTKGNIELMKYIYDKCEITIDSFIICIINNSLEVIKFVENIFKSKNIQIPQINQDIYNGEIIKVKNIKVAKWLIKTSYVVDKIKILLCIAYSLNLELEQFLKLEIVSSVKFMMHAMKYKNIETIKLLVKHGSYITEPLLCCANTDTPVHIIKFLFKQYMKYNPVLTKNLFRNISKFGDIEMIDTLIEEKCPKDDNWFNNIVLSNNYEALDYYYDKKHIIDSYAFEYVFDTTDYSTQDETDYVTDERNIKAFKMVKYLIKRKCPFDEYTIELACNFSNEIIRYLINHGCPYDESWNTFVDHMKKYI